MCFLWPWRMCRYGLSPIMLLHNSSPSNPQIKFEATVCEGRHTGTQLLGKADIRERRYSGRQIHGKATW
jgi:hypothetical protein